MKIGDEVYVHGYVNEIRNDVVIIRNDGGYFGTARNEIRPNDEDVGKPCYKIYVIAERRRFPNSYYNYFCDTVGCLNYWKKHILYGGEAILYAKERPFTRSDRLKLGKTVFWTKEEAEEAIGIIYKDEPQTDIHGITDCDFCKHGSEEWGSEACDGCCNANNHFEPKDEPQAERSE